MESTKKIIIYILVIIIIFSFDNVKALKDGEVLPDEQVVIREVIDAYYNRGSNAQYCSWRKSYIFAPEDSTSQHTTYAVCSHFTYSVYRDALGIELPPSSTSQLTAYANKYYDPDNIITNDVIEFWEQTNNTFKDNKGNKKILI